MSRDEHCGGVTESGGRIDAHARFLARARFELLLSGGDADEDAATKAGVKVRWRPFLVGPIFKAQGWPDSPFNFLPVKGRYMIRDLERICSSLHVPFRLPDPFPQNSVTAARIALIGHDEGWGIEFSKRVYHAEFGEGRDIGDRSVLSAILASLKLDADATLARAESPENKPRLRTETETAQALGTFGAPTFVTEDGELFWGNDRLEQALQWAGRREE